MAQQDLTHSNLTLKELERTNGLLLELRYRREETSNFLHKENIYKNVIQTLQSKEELYEQQKRNLELQIEAVKPEWYDHFWIGAAITGIIISSIYFLTN